MVCYAWGILMTSPGGMRPLHGSKIRDNPFMTRQSEVDPRNRAVNKSIHYFKEL